METASLKKIDQIEVEVLVDQNHLRSQAQGNANKASNEAIQAFQLTFKMLTSNLHLRALKLRQSFRLNRELHQRQFHVMILAKTDIFERHSQLIR